VTLTKAPINPSAVAAGDVDGDGNIDLLVTGRYGGVLAIFSNAGTATPFGGNETPCNAPAGAGPNDVAVGDFNRDGRLDAAVASGSNGAVVILLNTPPAPSDGGVDAGAAGCLLVMTSELSAGGAVVSVAVADFDGDQKLDVAGLVDTGSVAVFLGNGDGTFQNPGSYLVPGRFPRQLAAGDFSGDGKPDLAVAVQGADALDLLVGVGNGTFMASTSISTGASSGPVGVVIGDYNHDGLNDVVSANSTGNEIVVFLGVTGGGVGAGYHFAAGPAPVSIASADVNRDGKPDLVVPDVNLSVLINVTP
jgi:hypothetical protein